jgi:hypothetical protein
VEMKSVINSVGRLLYRLSDRKDRMSVCEEQH